VTEKVLAVDTNGQTDCLDLATGKLAPLPPYAMGVWGSLPKGARVPLEEELPSGVGIYRRLPYDASDTPSVYATGGTAMRRLSTEKWQEMSAAQVLTIAGTIQGQIERMGFVGPFPATFLFKTKTRTVGLMQVVGTNPLCRARHNGFNAVS
jgi:hypothetical protein